MSISKNKNLYVFKDNDGYFIGIKGTSIVRKITKYEYWNYRKYLEEWGCNYGDNKK